MLCYWILKRPDGAAVGHVRVSDGRVLLTLTAPVSGTFTLFSEGDAVPVLPGSEVALPDAVALLGTEQDRITCFAAAPNATSPAQYRARLSRIRTTSAVSDAGSPGPAPVPETSVQNRTIILEKTGEDADPMPDMSRNRTTGTDSISDSAREAQAFSAMLQHAEAFYAAYEEISPAVDVDNLVQNVDRQAEGGIDLFSQEYPGARWRYVDGTDVLPHYEGTWKQPNGPTLHILAVRGRAAPRPPRALLGFTRFLRDRDGTGYWLRLTPLP